MNCVARLATAIGFLFCAAPLAAQTSPLPADVETVISGGRWKTGDSDGNYRVVIRSVGYEVTISTLTIDWIRSSEEEDPAPKFLASVSIDLGLVGIHDPKLETVGSQWILRVSTTDRRTDPPLRTVYRISLGAPGAATLQTPPAKQRYGRADVEADGQLHVITTSGLEIMPRSDSGQVGVDQVAISADHRSVGWLALYPNCCTTYPIPLKLVVLSEGTERSFAGNDLPVWRWSFSADGKQVAFRQAPVHGPAPPHFELRDIGTGRLVSSFDRESGDVRDTPAWVLALMATP